MNFCNFIRQRLQAYDFLMQPHRQAVNRRRQFQQSLKLKTVNTYRILLLLFITPIMTNTFAQIKLKNLTSKKITNLYIVNYDSSYKTQSVCELIENKNLIKRQLLPGGEQILNIKLDPKAHYKLVCCDTTKYPNFYSDLIMKYYFPGSAKTISINPENVEADFHGHCISTIMESDKVDEIILNIKNNTPENLIKLYYKFNEDETFKRDNFFCQWKPIRPKENQKVFIYKPKKAEKIFIKYILEFKGELVEHIAQIEIEKGELPTELIIK